MKRPVAALAALALSAGCASLIDINDLRAPDPSVDGGGDASSGGGGDACAAREVTNLVFTPRGVMTALDATDVYFTRGDPPADSAILRCSKCGCAQPTELVSKLTLPGQLAVDDRYVFFTLAQEAGSLERIDKNDPQSRASLSGQETPLGVTVDAEHVYWTVFGGGPKGVATAGVWRARKSDFSQPTRLVAADELPDNIVPYAIAVDDTHVYYTTAPDLNDQSAEKPCNAAFGTVRRVKKDGGKDQVSQVIATAQACPVGLALSDQAVYWANLGTGTALAGSVWTQPKSGGAARMLADQQGRPTSIAWSGGRLSWNLPAQQRIATCTGECEQIDTLASAQLNPSGVSADSSGVYWMVLGTIPQNFTDGALRRASPP